MGGEGGGPAEWSLGVWERLDRLLPGGLSLSRLDTGLASFLLSDDYRRLATSISGECRECAALLEELAGAVRRVFGRADRAYLSLSLLVGARLAGRVEYEQVYSALGLPRLVGGRVVLGPGPVGEPLLDPLAWARELVSARSREHSIELRVGRSDVVVFTARGMRVLAALGLADTVRDALQLGAPSTGVIARAMLDEKGRLLVVVRSGDTLAVFPELLPLTEHVMDSLHQVFETLARAARHDAEDLARRAFPTLSLLSKLAASRMDIVISATPFTSDQVTGVYAHLSLASGDRGWLSIEVLSREAEWDSGGIIVLEGRGDRFAGALRAVAASLDHVLVEQCGVSCVRLSVYTIARADGVASALALLTLLAAESGANREDALGEAVAVLLGEKRGSEVQDRLSEVVQVWRKLMGDLLPDSDALSRGSPGTVVRGIFEGLVYAPFGNELRELEVSRQAVLSWYAGDINRGGGSAQGMRERAVVPESMLHALTALFSPSLYDAETVRDNPLLRPEKSAQRFVLARAPSLLPHVTAVPGEDKARVALGGLELEVPVRALWALPRDAVEDLGRELLAELAGNLKYELPRWVRAGVSGTVLSLSTLLASVWLEEVEGPEAILYLDDAKRLARLAAQWLPEAAGALPYVLTAESLVAGLVSVSSGDDGGVPLTVYVERSGVTRKPEPARLGTELVIPVTGVSVRGLPVKTVKIVFNAPKSIAVNVELAIPRGASPPRWVVSRACRAIGVGDCSVRKGGERGDFRVLVSASFPVPGRATPTVDTYLRHALERFSDLLEAWRKASNMLRGTVKKKYLYAWYALLVMELAQLNHTDDETDLALLMPPGRAVDALRRALGETRPLLALARLLNAGRVQVDDRDTIYIDGIPVERLESILTAACEPCSVKDKVRLGMERARLLLLALLASRSGAGVGETELARLLSGLGELAVSVVHSVSVEESVLLLEALTRLWSAATGIGGTVVSRGGRVLLKVGGRMFNVVGVTRDGRPVLLYRRGHTVLMFIMSGARELAYLLAGRKVLLYEDRRRRLLFYAPAGQVSRLRAALLPLLDRALTGSVEELVEEG